MSKTLLLEDIFIMTIHKYRKTIDKRGATTTLNNNSLPTYKGKTSGKTFTTKIVCKTYIPNVHFPYSDNCDIIL